MSRKYILTCTGRRIAIIRDHTPAREAALGLPRSRFSRLSVADRTGKQRAYAAGRRDAPWSSRWYPGWERQARTTDRRLAIVVPPPSTSIVTQLDDASSIPRGWSSAVETRELLVHVHDVPRDFPRAFSRERQTGRVNKGFDKIKSKALWEVHSSDMISSVHAYNRRAPWKKEERNRRPRFFVLERRSRDRRTYRVFVADGTALNYKRGTTVYRVRSCAFVNVYVCVCEISFHIFSARASLRFFASRPPWTREHQ